MRTWITFEQRTSVFEREHDTSELTDVDHSTECNCGAQKVDAANSINL